MANDSYTILVVDDDDDVRRIVRNILAMAGFGVELCAGGEEALLKARELLPDLVLLDVMMPGMDGLEVMAELRADPRTKEIPILFLSALSDEAVIVKGLKGASDYIVKPFKPLELEARIRKILDRVGKGGETRPAQELPLSSRIPVKLGKETYLIPLKDILYLEAAGKYSYAHIREKRYLTGFSIGELEKGLSENNDFVRINRSYIVNIEHILKVTRDAQNKTLVLVANEQHSALKVGESYLRSFKDHLGI